ncbi:MAG: methyltransferase domain-containing protein [Desulfobacterales bacterium]|nr:methyltransferase domain-containing protein [Desulfobacterales bacterium]
MPDSFVISRFQTVPLLDARKRGARRVTMMLDLGLVEAEALVEAEGVRLPEDRILSWEAIEEISASENGCFAIEDDGPRRIQAFSEFTNRSYSLMPTAKSPTMLISGFLMHRVRGTDPVQDTREKIKAVRPVIGRVLDTATGLGYTAIQAAKTADRVVTIELDPAAREIAGQNPWSRELFDNPKIELVLDDSFDAVQSFADQSFHGIIHDPPAFNMAGHLYSGEFYAQLRRVLKKGGRLFHYIGNPDSPSGKKITTGVIRRLKEAGFPRVTRAPRAFGVTAHR